MTAVPGYDPDRVRRAVAPGGVGDETAPRDWEVMSQASHTLTGVRCVVIDANAVVEGDWLLSGAAWRVLLDRSSAWTVELVVPEIVVREIVVKYRSKVAEQIKAYEQARTTLGRLGVHKMQGVLPDKGRWDYEAYLRDRLRSHRAVVASLPEVDIADLADRAITRRKPFDSKGSGFRDALVWATVKRYAEMTRFIDIALVSADRKAFADNEGAHLAPELVAEVATARVGLFRSVAALLADLGVREPELVMRVQERVTKEMGQIIANLRVAMAWSPVSFAETSILGSVSDVASVSAIHVEGVVRTTSEEALVTLKVDCQLILDVDAEITDRSLPSLWPSSYSGVVPTTLWVDVSYRVDRDELQGEMEVQPIEITRDALAAALRLQNSPLTFGF